MSKPKEILLAFYGDDFTGSTDALEFLTRAGARTVLFLDNPTEEQRNRFGDLGAVGVAGMTRAMEPQDMANTLKPAFESFKALAPRHIHYKVCSTFDSSPQIGNIGVAIMVGQEVLENEWTPILVAAPNLGRYSAFGNLYARMGIGSHGDIFRLDRHPSMSKHPITPADESDLREHLSRQIEADMGLIDLTDLAKPIEEVEEKLNAEIADEKDVVFFDAMYENQMAIIGKLLDYHVTGKPLFSVGSSGVEKALGDHWQAEGKLRPRTDWAHLKEVNPMLVLSGSVSPITADQIEYALQNGFEEVSIEVMALEEGVAGAELILGYQEQITKHLKAGKSVIVHTAKGSEDARLQQTKDYFRRKGLDELGIRSETAKRFGSILGQAALGALSEVPIERLVIAGGDTSSYVARELGIEAVEMIAPVYTGAPMCRAYAAGSPVDGIEVNLKGGQVGDERYFENIRKGKI